MYIRSKTVAILLLTSNLVNNSDIQVNAFTSPSFMKVTGRMSKDQYNYNAVIDAELETETDSKSKTTIEEKAWKIVDEKTKDVKLDSKAVVTQKMKEDEKKVEAKIPIVKAVAPVVELEVTDLLEAIEEEASMLVDEMVDEMQEECEVTETGEAADELCVDESKLTIVKSKLKKVVSRTLGFVRTGGDGSSDEENTDLFVDEYSVDFDGAVPEGELLERGWEMRGNSSALRRNAEVWKFALKCVFKALKPRKMKKNDASEEEIKEAQTEAATFIRNGLLRLGPSFVKLVS